MSQPEKGPYFSPISIPDLVDAAIKRGCEVCMGDGWVCEDHPLRPAHDGCGCGAPGMPCVCTGLNDVPAEKGSSS